MKMTLNTKPAVSPPSCIKPGEDGLYLTRQEREVLQLIVAGRSSRQIANDLHMGRRRARAMVGSILAELCPSVEVQDALKALYS
jgi:DNA-binding NarL/FixJ family response regulator